MCSTARVKNLVDELVQHYRKGMEYQLEDFGFVDPDPEHEERYLQTRIQMEGGRSPATADKMPLTGEEMVDEDRYDESKYDDEGDSQEWEPSEEERETEEIALGYLTGSGSESGSIARPSTLPYATPRGARAPARSRPSNPPYATAIGAGRQQEHDRPPLLG